MTKVFIVILNWNRAKDTIDCLKSLLKINKINIDVNILIVDNASSDNSVEKLENCLPAIAFAKAGKLKIIRNNTNLGFAEGNNIGIRHSLTHGADFVLLLNNDTFVDKKLLKILVNTALDHKDAGAISPKIYFAKGFEFHKDRYTEKDKSKVIWYGGGVIDWNNVYASNKDVDKIDKSLGGSIEKTDFTTGACVLLRKEALEMTGIFDKKYFMYLEDVDLCMRLQKKGWKTLYAPKARVWHKVAQSSGIGSQLNDYFITRNRLMFGFKYADRRAKIALIKESIKFLFKGRKWQKIGARDFYIRRFGVGSWK